jgi:hypothetical protein
MHMGVKRSSSERGTEDRSGSHIIYAIMMLSVSALSMNEVERVDIPG